MSNTSLGEIRILFFVLQIITSYFVYLQSKSCLLWRYVRIRYTRTGAVPLCRRASYPLRPTSSMQVCTYVVSPVVRTISAGPVWVAPYAPASVTPFSVRVVTVRTARRYGLSELISNNYETKEEWDLESRQIGPESR